MACFQARLDHLFRTFRAPDGGEYTYRQVADGIEQLVGYKTSDTLSVSDLTPAPSAADIGAFTPAAPRPELVQAVAQRRGEGSTDEVFTGG